MTGKSATNQLLGYSDDARLLIINADDFGMCHSINAAILHSLRDGIVRSTSLMVPCPWALHAMQILRENPSISFAIHLTLICEHPHYKWRPLTPKAKVPSLVDETGYFYPISRMAEFAAQADLSELETEFRAQINAVLNVGLQPTHLDWHCLHNGGRPDIFDLTFRLAREYGLALRVSPEPYTGQVQAHNLPANEYPLLDSYRMETQGKHAQYIQMLRDLPAGLTEWAVHPASGNAEMQAVEPGSWTVRQADYEFVMSMQAREVIQEEGIILIDYKTIRDFWRTH